MITLFFPVLSFLCVLRIFDIFIRFLTACDLLHETDFLFHRNIEDALKTRNKSLFFWLYDLFDKTMQLFCEILSMDEK